MAFGVPMFVARWARYDWSLQLRSLLRGGGKHNREFQPILRDLRELVGQMANEREDVPGTVDRGTPQTDAEPASARREDRHSRKPRTVHPSTHANGQIEVQHPASGLVTALEPVMRACSGVWVAHGSGNADRETVDRHDRVAVPPGEESYHIRRVWLSEEELRGYYYGFSNEGLWPLCHVAHARPIFRAEDWRHYRRSIRSSPTRCAVKWTPTIRSSWCRTTTSLSLQR